MFGVIKVKLWSNNLDIRYRVDCRYATGKILRAVLGKSDFQIGKTKVFLKDAQDLFLEQERDRVLTRKILILQKAIRGWFVISENDKY